MWPMAGPFEISAGLSPFDARKIEVTLMIMSWVTRAMDTATIGITAIGTKSFANTAVTSDTGSDFQNSRLRSRRSPCIAPEQ